MTERTRENAPEMVRNMGGVSLSLWLDGAGETDCLLVAGMAARINALNALNAETIRAHIYEQTHGDPPNRECLPGSDERWQGYLLGVEEAARAVESFEQQALAALREIDREGPPREANPETWAYRLATIARKALGDEDE